MSECYGGKNSLVFTEQIRPLNLNNTLRLIFLIY